MYGHPDQELSSDNHSRMGERIYDRRESTDGIHKDQVNLNFTEHLFVTQSVNFYIKLFLMKLDSL